VKYTILLLTLVLGASVAFAQTTPAPAGNKLSGVYEGTLAGQTDKVELQLKSEGQPLGQLQVGQKTYDITEAMVTGGTVSLVFKEGKLTGKIDGDKIVGDLWVGADKKAIELRRVPPTPATPATPESKFTPNGDWDAVADANGQPFPFALTLKVEGEKVTGSSSSQLGESTVKDGVWKDGHLTFVLEGQNGAISMSATAVDGKLSGEFDYSGQLSGKWVAVRKQ
jgi:hypothetical protein